jgi:hypothetical protein
MIIAFAIPFFVSPSREEMPSRVAFTLGKRTPAKSRRSHKDKKAVYTCLTTPHFAAIY